MNKLLALHLKTGRLGPLVAACLLGVAVVSSAPATHAQKKPVPAELQEAERLAREADRLFEARNYGAAIPLAERVLAIRERLLPADSVEIDLALCDLADLLRVSGKHAKAEPLYRRALQMREKALGPEHRSLAGLLDDLAFVYWAMADYGKAEPLFARELALLDKAVGPDSLEAATAAQNLGDIHRVMGAWAKAEPLYRRALATRERKLAPEHEAIAETLNAMAMLLAGQHDPGAEQLYLRALGIQAKRFGRESHEYATTLDNLAQFYGDSDSARAREMSREALAIMEKVHGPKHIAVARVLNTLASYYAEAGDYAAAETSYQRAIAIWEEIHGPEHPDVAAGVGNLADLYQMMGDENRAEPLLLRALAIREKRLGPDHPDVAFTVIHLGNLYARRGDHAKAEAAYLRVVALREKAFGPEHPQVGIALGNLGDLYRTMGQADKAEPLFRRALAIAEKAFGRDDPRVGVALNNLGLVFRFKQEPAAGEPYFQRAAELLAKGGGADNPDLAPVLVNLAIAKQARGDLQGALKAFERVNEIRERNLANVLTTGSEEQKAAYARAIDTDTLLTVALHTGPAASDASARELALLTILQRKGRVLDAETDTMAVLRKHLDPEHQKLLSRLALLRGRIARSVLGGNDSAAASQKLRDEADRLEAELSRASAQHREKTRTTSLQLVKQSVPRGAALVELYLYRPYDPRKGVFGEPRYAAYGLWPDRTDWRDLGAAAPIDESVRKLRSALASPESDARTPGRELHDKVMRPIRDMLGETRVVFLSPDGQLNLVPFAALVDDTGHHLAERYSFSYLSSGRDLLRQTDSQPARERDLVIADPAFDTSSRGGEAGGTRSAGLGKVRFTPLAGTGQEARAIGTLLQGASVLVGEQATEGNLKKVGGPRILHVATHGFFLSDEKQQVNGARGLVLESGEPGPARRVSNPLLRSGIALAGANTRQSEGEDGILTALEASALDLWGTKLVVLSACETGVGDVQNGQGVYGLRRALVLAGSETQVMSLWKVDDEATRDLMVAYYGRLQKGEGRSEAMRSVQLEMLATPRRSHPYYWASFIVSGNPRNLQGVESGTTVPAVSPGPRGCGCNFGPERGAAWYALGASALLGFACRRRRRT